MAGREMAFRLHHFAFARALIAALSILVGSALPSATAGQTPSNGSRVVGTIQAISGKSLGVIADSGALCSVSIEDATKLLQIEPGKTDLKEARPLSYDQLQAGDRVLVRGVLADDGTTIRATSVIAVKKAALDDKRARERAEWQRGVGGIVKSIDPAALTILISTNGVSSGKEVLVHFGKGTILRRYAADSTRFDAAEVRPASEIKPGDQLRTRGSRGENGVDFNAAEIVSGTFRTIAGTILSSDSATSTLVVEDLASKAPVTLKITAESQMRKLPPQFAEGLATRLKNQSAGAAQSSTPAAPGASGENSRQGAGSVGAQSGRGNGSDFQQLIARMPAAAVADLHPGDAVMVVSTPGNSSDPLTVITLLGGVEAILRASPGGSQDMILSPWSLGGGEPAPN
jgi:hypothetical protein